MWPIIRVIITQKSGDIADKILFMRTFFTQKTVNKIEIKTKVAYKLKMIMGRS
ncbi:MAG: hypothetical protein LBS26_07290 [Campylobacteraceae bacterium]|jgi:hypothetical protein|nr:hypothetical protein [Campylobacteraceae bacterium]